MLSFRTSARTYNDPEITPVEVDRVTDQSVFIRGRRNARVTTYEVYHDTWQAARDYLIQLWENTATHRRDELMEAEAMLAKSRMLTEEAQTKGGSK